ncbi:MAG: outer membrane lipoprotein carrier protein LolA [Gammaproteobacteria bacterium]|nr:outer membrane lipoprotein carrier protein LolA [Gammaproteobacteria bacterium]
MNRLPLITALLLLSFNAHSELSFSQLEQITDMPDKHAGTFVQEKYLQAVDASLESRGVFDYERGKSIRWEILEPIQSELLMTPAGISSTQNGETLLQLDASANPAAAALGEILFALLTADWAILESHVELSGSIDGDNWHAVLEPLEQSTRLAFTRVELSGRELLEKIVLHESSGDRTTIRLD